MEQKIRRDRNMGSNLRRLRDQYGISQEKLCAEPVSYTHLTLPTILRV